MKSLVKLTSNELRLFWREPATVFFALAFPTLLLVILGSIKGFRDPNPMLEGHRAIDLYVPIMIAFALGMLSLQAMPAALATYREKRILRRLAVTPVGATRVVQAQMLMSLALTLGAVVALIAVGRIAYDVALPGNLLAFALALVLEATALIAIGVALAAILPTGRAANAVGTLTFFPLMFFAGLWIPRAAMPELVRSISDYTPLGAGVQALQDASSGAWPHLSNLGVLAAYVVLFATIAATRFRWE